MPWLPLPLLMTTGREHPLIRASLPAAAAGLEADTVQPAGIPRVLHKDAAGLHTVVAFETLVRDGGVIVDLAADELLHILHFHRVREFQDVGHIEEHPVRTAALFFAAGVGAAVQQDRAVLLHVGDVVVVLLDLDLSGVSAALQLHHDIQVVHVLHQLAGAEALLHQCLGGLDIRRRHGLQHGQLPVRVSAHDAQGGRHVDAAHTAGVGDDDALHVFDDVAAAPDPAVLWYYAQQLPRLGAGIGDGDGLGAAQGHQQFLPKDAEVILIKCLIHAVSLSYLGWYLKMNTCKAQANRIK